MSFKRAYLIEILCNLPHNYKNNFDYYRFKDGGTGNKPPVFTMIRRVLENVRPLNTFYNRLANHRSRKLLVKLMALQTLGYKKVKLPLNTLQFWEGLEQLEKFKNEEDFIRIDFLNWKLNRFRLNGKGNNFDLYYVNFGIYQTFYLEQYAYRSAETQIEAKPGDYVIDAGGCFGDTSLYFAAKVQQKGKVFTFEFVPENIQVMQKNFSLNRGPAKNIHLVEKALWDKSAETLYYAENGPGSSLIRKHKDKACGVKTVTIDDFVEENQITHIDFIKMDIEGAELNALKGAVKTIRAFKPKLAISLYHRFNDFIDIPEFLSTLGVEYNFYLGHYTIHNEETILFAKGKN